MNAGGNARLVRREDRPTTQTKVRCGTARQGKGDEAGWDHSQPAMLTGGVNIAVFAAFRFCRRGVLLSNAEFKPFGGPRELDVLGYGWQKRQETATIWQRMAWWAATTVTLAVVSAASTRSPHCHVRGCDRARWADVRFCMRLLRCERRGVAPQ